VAEKIAASSIKSGCSGGGACKCAAKKVSAANDGATQDA